MTDHTNTATQGKSKKKEAFFQAFLDGITKNNPAEVGLAIGDGAVYLAHKDFFKNIEIQDIIGLNVSIIDGAGTSEFRLLTPGSVIPQLPVHIHKEDDDEDEYEIQRLSPWAVILKGGEHLNSTSNEQYLNYNTNLDAQLKNFSKHIAKKQRNNDFRSMCYGHSENICTDPDMLKLSTVEAICDHAFSFIPQQERKDYVLYINGTHLLYLWYAINCVEGSEKKLSKHKVYMSPNTFKVNVDNTHLNNSTQKNIYICPLHLGNNNIFLQRKFSGNILQVNSNEHIGRFNNIFKKYFNYGKDDCKELPSDKFIAGMFSSLTMEIIPTPFQILHKVNDDADTLFTSRLNFIATQMLGVKGSKNDDDLIRPSDKTACMIFGAVTQLQISPNAFECFRENTNKADIEYIDTNWTPDELSTIYWNIDNCMDSIDENADENDKKELKFKLANDSSIFNFLAIVDRLHMYNCEMILNNCEWQDLHKISCTDTNSIVNLDFNKENVKKTKEKCFFEHMRRSHDLQFSELIYLRQNCNIFRYKSNILYPIHYILRNVNIDLRKEPQALCADCNNTAFNITDGSLCLCNLFYAACCSLFHPGKRSKLTTLDIHRMRNTFNQKLKTEDKFSKRPSYKSTHCVPLIDPYNNIECNGGINIVCPKGPIAIDDENEKNPSNPKNNNKMPLLTVMKIVQSTLNPLFTERYTISPHCVECIGLQTSSKIKMNTCEDINIVQFIQDYLIQNHTTTPLNIKDNPIPTANAIPIIKEGDDYDDDVCYSYSTMPTEYSSLINPEGESKDKKFIKHTFATDDNLNDTFENDFSTSPARKKLRVNDNFQDECNEFVTAVLYSYLANNDSDETPSYEDLKSKLDVNNLLPSHYKFLKKVKKMFHKDGGKEIAEKCVKLKHNMIKGICEKYFWLLGNTMMKTFHAVAKAIKTQPDQLDSDFSNISIHKPDYGDNNSISTGNEKANIRSLISLDIHAPNSIIRKSTTLSYIGHIKHQIDVANGLKKNTYPDVKSIDARVSQLAAADLGINAEVGTLRTPFGLIDIENNSSDNIPLLKLLNPMTGSPTITKTFLAPPLGKIRNELTEMTFEKKSQNKDNGYEAGKNMFNIIDDGYNPCPLINFDKSDESMKKYDAVDANTLYSAIKNPSVKFQNMLSHNFLSTENHDLTVRYIKNYLTMLNSVHYSTGQSSLPPLIYNVIFDIRRIICKIVCLFEIPTYIYDIFIGKKTPTKLHWPDISTPKVIQTITDIMKGNSVITGFFHLYCLMTELYGDTIGVSQSNHYNTALERRASWIKTFCRGYLRLCVGDGGNNQLKWKTFRTFVANNSFQNNENLLIPTLNHNAIPAFGSYLLANMMYISYIGIDGKTIYRRLTFGDPFFSNSIYSSFLDLNSYVPTDQIIIGRHALYKNWTRQKIDIEYLSLHSTMTSFVDIIANKVVSISDLIQYYYKNSIIPENNIKDQKEEIITGCLNIHENMIKDSYDKRTYMSIIFPKVWSILIGNNSSDDEDSEDMNDSTEDNSENEDTD